MLDLLIPLILIGVAVFGLWKKQNVYECLLEGGLEGLKLLLSIVPALVILLTGVHMLRASGGLKLIEKLVSPVTGFLGIPAETLPLVLIRPFSGSGALAVGADLMKVHGPDSLVGRTAAIMLGSTETTFYTISVYFSAAGIKKTRYAVPAALIADLTGFIVASLCGKML